MNILLSLFWIFLKINLLSTSGSASIGLLYSETVGGLLTDEQFVQAVGLSTLLPGSDALQLAMFVGYTVAGIPGSLISIFAAVLPPTVLMLGLVLMLHRFQREAWVSRFVEGLTPAVAVLILTVAWKMFSAGGDVDWKTITLGAISFIALIKNAPAPLVLLGAGIAGIFLFQ
ncbi:MAG TPA: chromate transporter [Anaerolineales bacterium]|nr:chromate transporter [Anaerolineales bacterium]